MSSPSSCASTSQPVSAPAGPEPHARTPRIPRRVRALRDRGSNYRQPSARHPRIRARSRSGAGRGARYVNPVECRRLPSVSDTNGARMARIRLLAVGHARETLSETATNLLSVWCAFLSLHSREDHSARRRHASITALRRVSPSPKGRHNLPLRYKAVCCRRSR